MSKITLRVLINGELETIEVEGTKDQFQEAMRLFKERMKKIDPTATIELEENQPNDTN